MNVDHDQAMTNIVAGFRALGFTIVPKIGPEIGRGVTILWGDDGLPAIHIQIMHSGRVMVGVQSMNWQSRV